MPDLGYTVRIDWHYKCMQSSFKYTVLFYFSSTLLPLYGMEYAVY